LRTYRTKTICCVGWLVFVVWSSACETREMWKKVSEEDLLFSLTASKDLSLFL